MAAPHSSRHLAERKEQPQDHFRYLLRTIATCACISIALEAFLFNLPHWVSLSFRQLNDVALTIGPGLTANDDGTYTIIDASGAYLEFEDIDAHVDNVYLDAAVGNSPITAGLAFSDEASSGLRNVPDISVYSPVTSSRYIRIHSSGQTSTVRITFDGHYDVGTTVTINDYSLNRVVPLQIRPLRMLIAFIVLTAAALLLPKSPLHRIPFDANSKPQMVASIAILIPVIALTVFTCIDTMKMPLDPQSDGTGAVWAWEQYGYLEESLMKGSVSLDLPVSDWLTTVDNPYDPSQRAASATTDEPYYVDYAYYQGRYYSYFGVTPAILVGIPYTLLMGHHPSTQTLVAIWAAIAQVGLLFLVRQLCTRYGEHRVSIGLFYVLWLSTFIASGFLYHTLIPQTYAVPYMAGFSCVFIGLGAWLKSLAARGAYIQKKWLVLGSASVALSIGCRPTFFLSVLLAFPIFYDEIIFKREFFAANRAAAINTLCVLLPCIALGCLFGLYNYVRFGSFLDFGASYNLTGNDMTHRGFVLARFPLGLFDYLLQLPSVAAQFPFLSTINGTTVALANTYYGATSAEPLYGGYLFFNPLTIYLMGRTPKAKSRNQSLAFLYWAVVVLALLNLLIVIQYSGITQRYMSDFGWLLGIANAVALIETATRKRSRRSELSLIRSVYVLTLFSLVLMSLEVTISGGYNGFASNHTYLYYTLRSMFMLM